MYLMSTTYGWNLGDDLIREGVYNLLGIKESESIIWLNYSEVRANKYIPLQIYSLINNFLNKSRMHSERQQGCLPLWDLQNNFPSNVELVKNADGLIVAGTPAWFSISIIYKLCIKYKIPIYLVGVGQKQPNYAISILKKAMRLNLIYGATVRDTEAQVFLNKCGIKAELFFEPAFHANYYKDLEKDIDLIFTPLLDKPYLKYYKELYNTLKEEISIISVHEPYEYVIAKRIFNKPIFFNSDYNAYKTLYSRCKQYIGGRSHGAIPIISMGGFANLICHKNKQKMAKIWESFAEKENIFSTIKSYNYDEISLIKLMDSFNSKDMLKLLSDDFNSHQQYWKEII
ncbi:MAG: polysaccharide pyruvyl transferase family protein [Promethearchaeota archaeon]